MVALFVKKLRRRERDRAKRAAETKEEREVRLHKRRETDRARHNRERQGEISDVETAEQSLRREIEDSAGETEQLWRLLSKVIFPLKYLTSGFSYLLLLVKPPSLFHELRHLNAPSCLTHRILFSVPSSLTCTRS